MGSYNCIFLTFFCVFVAVLGIESWNHCTSNPNCRCIPKDNKNYIADCSNLAITEVPRTRPDVDTLNIGHNRISHIMHPFSPTLVNLDMSYNQLQNFTHDVFANLTRLRTLNLEGNQLQLDDSVLRPEVFRDIKALRSINIKKTIVKAQSTFPYNMWGQLSSLETLRIDVISSTQFGRQFRSLRSLTVLDVSGCSGFCSIEEIGEKFLENLPHLEILDLSCCQIKGFSAGALKKQRNITVLDISYNENLHLQVLQRMESLDLSLQMGSTPISDLIDAFTCQNPIRPSNNTIESHSNKFNTEPFQMRYNTSITETLPRNLRTLILRTCGIRLELFRILVNPSNQLSHVDLSQNLEESRGLRLCLSKRDFRPGTEIAANITEAITKSRKTIIILSNHFLNSYWCMYEFNMARMESIYTRNGKHVLFMVMYRHVTAKMLPLSMLALVESHSYIEYPDDPQGNIVFWDKVADTCRNPSD
ncbi:toll-like receptor 4 [Saccostrea cucullata]|uniref:toll-like receptor 4 n=1 Tax=Saccostrea cuccullata TaxID=36930 RepID=UPI002ED30054